jgi:hypothetical protein
VVFLIWLGKISLSIKQQIELLATAGFFHDAIHRTFPNLVIFQIQVFAEQDSAFCRQLQCVVDGPALVVYNLGQSRQCSSHRQRRLVQAILALH